jgi:uncharacterized cupredoxin-like copper-binding protein
MSFAQTHIATLFKYGGISFIAGAVNHGFFSESRSIWTAGFGVLFYLLGSWLDIRNAPARHVRWGDVLGFGLLSSIGLGFFTGGLQHFPDSPDRSLWVVPLGFVLSLLAMYFMDWRGQLRARALVSYGLISFAVVMAGSAAAWSVLQGAPVSEHSHSHGEASAAPEHNHDAHSHDAAAGDASMRTVTITMDDAMRFTPANWQATSGETVRIRVVNTGKVRHEFIIGTEAELKAHAQEMKKPSAHHHQRQRAQLGAGVGRAGDFCDAGVLHSVL